MNDVLMLLSQVCLWLALLAGLAFAIGRRPKHPWCRKCNYDLSSQAAQPGPWTCPECGRRYTRATQLRKRRRSRWAAFGAIVLLGGWYATGVTPRILSHGWRGAVPSLALVLSYPWNSDILARSRRNAQMQVLLNGATSVTASLRDSLRPATLRDELASREIRPPLDAIWALRSRFKSKSLPAEDLVVSIRAVDAATYACHMLPSWLVSPEAEIAKLDATANRLGSYGNSAMAVGDFIFVYTRSPEFVEEVARSCRLRREFMSGSGDDGHDDSAATTVKAWKTLHHAIIHLDQPQATMIECIDEVRRVTGLPFQVDDSIASSTELWKTPRASSAPEFLNELFSTVLTRGLETTYVSSRRCWGVRAGSVWVSLSHATKGTRSTAAIHEFSIASDGKAGERAWSDTYQRYLKFKIGSSDMIGLSGFEAKQPTAIVRGTQVFLVMSEGEHDLLDDFLQGRFDPSKPGEN